MKKIEDIFLSDREREIVQKIRESITAVMPDATVIFFGSRARGNPNEHSDWDILILTDEKIAAAKSKVYDVLYDVELEYDIIVGPLMISRNDWESKRFKNHAIRANIEQEGVVV